MALPIATYREALEARAAARATFARLADSVDAVITLTAPDVAPLGLASTGHTTAAAVVLGATLALGVALRLARPESVLASALYLDADTALMRVVDVLLSFPFLLLVMALGAALDRTSVATILWTLGLTGWLGTARVVRARTLQVKALDFVLAARALGQSSAGIVARHLLPNVAGPLIVIATASVAQMILAESVLSYLGVGIAPPTATWGRLLFEGQDAYLSAPWMLAAPAAAIVVSVFGFNLLGEGLRDALDPRG
jgi:peptide/nickel transport system permease protein